MDRIDYIEITKNKLSNKSADIMINQIEKLKQKKEKKR